MFRSLLVLSFALAGACAPALAPQKAAEDPASPNGPAAPLPVAGVALQIASSSPSETNATGGDQTLSGYTCPMHPEVTSDEPSRCPKCNMQLVPIKKREENQPKDGGHHHE